MQDGAEVIADGIFVGSSGRVDGTNATIRVGTAAQQSGAVVNQGLLAVGTSPGMLTIDGNYVQEPTGRLEIEIGGLMPGSQYDQLIVTGDASLGGTLEPVFIDGFAPQAGQQFELMSAGGAWDASFSDVSVRGLLPGFEFELIGDGGAFLMTALNNGVVPRAADFDEDGDVHRVVLDRSRSAPYTCSPVTPWRGRGGEMPWRGEVCITECSGSATALR